MEDTIFQDCGVFDGYYLQGGVVGLGDADDSVITLFDLQFRLATNGVIVNTIVNGEPLFTTSAGTFN